MRKKKLKNISELKKYINELKEITFDAKTENNILYFNNNEKIQLIVE